MKINVKGVVMYTIHVIQNLRFQSDSNFENWDISHFLNEWAHIDDTSSDPRRLEYFLFHLILSTGTCGGKLRFVKNLSPNGDNMRSSDTYELHLSCAMSSIGYLPQLFSGAIGPPAAICKRMKEEHNKWMVASLTYHQHMHWHHSIYRGG